MNPVDFKWIGFLTGRVPERKQVGEVMKRLDEFVRGAFSLESDNQETAGFAPALKGGHAPCREKDPVQCAHGNP